MLISLKANNYCIYNSEIEFSLHANMHYKNFRSNYSEHKGINVLKTAILIGPNNSGKTNFVHAVATIRDIMLNTSPVIHRNLFADNSICELSVSFLDQEDEYLFEVRYDTKKSEYIYERFAQVIRDSYGNVRENDLLIRDAENKRYISADENLLPVMQVASRNNILIHLISTENFPILNKIKDTMLRFASKIDIIDMNNIPISKTIEMLKLSAEAQQKIANFILNADLSLDDYRYLSDDEIKLDLKWDKSSKPQESVLSIQNTLVEMMHLASVYKGVVVPSMLFDSTGTKKMAALASYVIAALEQGRILIVDELDNSLHFKLTRAIIALFNNELNPNAQLIATVHDVSLLDCKTLFRKEQIWFTHKDRDNAYLYSLSEFKADKNGIRSTTDLIEQYRRGVFGALPEPDLFNSLLEVHSNV